MPSFELFRVFTEKARAFGAPAAGNRGNPISVRRGMERSRGMGSGRQPRYQQ